jgi:hypothetical protein
MDISALENIIRQQFTCANSLQSLKIQNHIYGCFILMEDIAENTVSLTENSITGSGFSFDLDTQFENIGLRYGFVLDTKLALDSFLPEYKTQWLHHFKTCGISKNLKDVDVCEDSIITIIHQHVKEEQNFFVHALETGVLSQEWVGKILVMLTTTEDTEASFTTVATVAPVVENNKLTVSQIEKHISKKNPLSKTKRQPVHSLPSKKYLANTRRAIKKVV